LDNDGKREFIFANLALNNTLDTMHGLDDNSGHITIVDPRGKLVSQHKIFVGLGDTKLQIRDVDQDGLPDIYARISTQGADTDADMILRLSYASGQLKRIKELNLPNTLEFNPAVYCLQRLDNSANYYLVINDNLQGLMLYDKHLVDITPRKTPNIKAVLAIADIKQKGYKSIIALSNKDEIVVLNHNFKELARLGNPFPDKRDFWLEVIDNGRGNERQIAVMSRQTLMLYSLDSIPISSYIYQQLKIYYPLISLALLILLVYVLILLKQQRKIFVESVNQLEEGLIFVSRKGRISDINKAAITLILEHNPHANLKYLEDSLPALSNALKSFRSKWIEYEDSQVQIAGRTMRVHVERFKGVRSSYLICLFSLLHDGEEQSLEWAETARRLSHHVRRHITNVILALDPLESTENEAHKEYLEMAKSEIEKIRIFTHAFQRFTEMRDYELKLQDLVPSIEHALNQVRIPDNVFLIKNYKLDSIHTRIEPIRFEEALVNTINNATEAMPTGGNLQITITAFPPGKSPKTGRSILVELEDSGKGIPAKYMDDIFKPFFTTNQFGTGIGIPETRKILDSMGGIFEIHSEEGLGTTVSLWLKGEHDD
jgi:signal transduction histidine kinase